jgi:hypothetical protein
MCTSVCTGLSPFNFIRKHFLQTCIQKVTVCVYSDFPNALYKTTVIYKGNLTQPDRKMGTKIEEYAAGWFIDMQHT